MEPYFEDICQREIDGAASPQERQELEQLTRRDPDIAREIRRSRDVAHSIESVGLVEPPAELADDVMGIVEAFPDEGGVRRSLWARISNAVDDLRTREVLSFSAGVVLGVVLLFFVGSQHLRDFDGSSGVGTIGVPALDDGNASRLQAPGLGQIAAEFAGERLITRISPTTAQEWTLSYDDDSVHLMAVEAFGGATGWVQHEQGRLSVRQRGGEQYRILFEANEGVMRTDLNLTMKSRGSQFEGTLECAKRGSTFPR